MYALRFMRDLVTTRMVGITGMITWLVFDKCTCLLSRPEPPRMASGPGALEYFPKMRILKTCT